MHDPYLQRVAEKQLEILLDEFPAVAILGPRQTGKSTLAGHYIQSIDDAQYLDLERPSDLRKLTDPELYFSRYANRLICLDEIQRIPELFSVLRSVIDRENRNGQFLILGSASRDLIKQSSETLAGRIAFIELTPFQIHEIHLEKQILQSSLQTYWNRGGLPRSYLAKDCMASLRWREQYVQTFLERDIPQLGFQIPAGTLKRLWKMCAHYHAQLLNSSRLGEALGLSHTTVRKYLDILVQTFMVRLLEPFEVNLKKRLVKSPKIYIRDSGILHTLLEVENFEQLMGHPVYGASWEGLAIEAILNVLPNWRSGFYRTLAGAELDLVVERGQKRMGFEFKASMNPQLTRGFWQAIEDLQLNDVRIIAPVNEAYPIQKGVMVMPIHELLSELPELVKG